MFERYTEAARRLLFFGRFEASALGSQAIETEHLLLGLARVGAGIGSQILSEAGLSYPSLSSEIEKRADKRWFVPTSVEIPFSDGAKRVLRYAAEEADRLLHSYIGTEHLLLGLLREEHGVVAEILGASRLRLEDVRQRVREMSTSSPPPEVSMTSATRITVSESRQDRSEALAIVERIRKMVMELAGMSQDKHTAYELVAAISLELELLQERITGE